MWILGILCIAYYGLIGWTLKKWDSTFARFWPAAAVAWFLIGTLAYISGDAVRMGLKLALGAAFVVFLLTEGVILAWMIPGKDQRLAWLVVLGAHVAGTRITDSLKRRLDRAADYLRKHPEARVVVSGGQGEGEAVTEAAAMREYLIRSGIDPRRIVCEDQSRTTKENLEYSAAYIQDLELPVGIVTNNFHMYRACRYARKAGYREIGRLPASCHPVLLANYLMREFFAVLKLWCGR